MQLIPPPGHTLTLFLVCLFGLRGDGQLPALPTETQSSHIQKSSTEL